MVTRVRTLNLTFSTYFQEDRGLLSFWPLNLDLLISVNLSGDNTSSSIPLQVIRIPNPPHRVKITAFVALPGDNTSDSITLQVIRISNHPHRFKRVACVALPGDYTSVSIALLVIRIPKPPHSVMRTACVTLLRDYASASVALHVIKAPKSSLGDPTRSLCHPPASIALHVIKAAKPHNIKTAAWVSLPGAYTFARFVLHVIGARKHPHSIETAAL
jgi:hypothetical protein